MGIMPSIGLESRRGVIGFVLCVSVAWLLALRLTGRHELSATAMLWAFASALWGRSLLSWTDYFKGWRPFPRKSDVIVFALALFPTAVAAKYLAGLLDSGHAPVRYREILLGSPLAALAAYACQWFGGFWTFARNERRGILLVLLPEEREEIESELRAWRLHRKFELLDYERLETFDGQMQLVVISRRATRALDAHSTVIQAHLAGIPVVDARQFLCDLRKRVVTESTDAWTFLVGATPQTIQRRAYARLKVWLEPPIAMLGLMLLSPLILAIVIAIKLDSKGPIFYWQTRVGYRGKLFRIAKFRSMRTDAEAQSPRWAMPADTRVTRVGRVLRAFRLDEIPQLFNVALGDMALVGPRPERPEFCEMLRELIPLFSMRTLVRPGVTGWAQVHAGYAASIEESRRKLEYDLYYIQHLSPRLDIVIALRTIQVFFSGGAHVTSARAVGAASSGDMLGQLAGVPGADRRRAVESEGAAEAG